MSRSYKTKSVSKSFSYATRDQLFVLPAGRKGALAEARAKPSYHEGKDPPVGSLVDYRHVLRGLASPAFGATNRAHIWHGDFADYIQNGAEALTGYEGPADILRGKGAAGFNITVLRAQADGGRKPKECFLYVIDDTVRNKMIVVGPKRVDPLLSAELKKNGIQYVSKDRGPVTNAVNEFLARGGRERGYRGKMGPWDVPNLIEDLIKACCIICEPPAAMMDPTPPNLPGAKVISARATVGAFLQGAQEPSMYTSIAKPRPR